MDGLDSLEDKSVSLILTDPPYNLGNFMKERNTNLKAMRQNFFGSAGWDNLEYDAWIQMMDSLFEKMAKVIKIGGSLLMFISLMKTDAIIQLAQKHGFYYKTIGVWHKQNPMPRNMNLHFINSLEGWLYFTFGSRTGIFNNNSKAIHDFVEMPVCSKSEKKFGSHPTQKPVALMEFFVNLLSNTGDVILDPFMGVGSTGVAALRNGRDFVGFELSQEYYNIACQRIEEVKTLDIFAALS